LLQWPEPLVACGDIGHYTALRRFREAEPGGEFDARQNTFNAGFILVGEPLLSDARYAELLERTHPATFVGRRAALVDQVVFNVVFEGQARIAPGVYNYLLACHETISASEGTPLTQARVIHFNFGRKPWLAGEALRASMRDPVVAAACGMWLECWAACLKEFTLRAAFEASHSGSI